MAKLIVLGTSAATPKPRSSLSSYYFEHDGLGILMDAGEGTQYQLMKARVRFSKIKLIVISHLHGDHVLGLPGLLETMSMGSRKEELIVIAPEGIYNFIECSFKYTYFKPAFPIKIIEVKDEFELSIGNNVSVKVFPVKHIVPTIGTKISVTYKRKVKREMLEKKGVPKRLWGKIQNCEEVRFKGEILNCEDFTWPPRQIKVVYSGDTAPCEKLVVEARKANLLIHESTFTRDMAEEAHERGHSTAMDAALTASKAEVDMLLLTHFSMRYKDPRVLLDEARIFFRNAYLAEELMKVVIK